LLRSVWSDSQTSYKPVRKYAARIERTARHHAFVFRSVSDVNIKTLKVKNLKRISFIDKAGTLAAVAFLCNGV